MKKKYIPLALLIFLLILPFTKGSNKNLSIETSEEPTIAYSEDPTPTPEIPEYESEEECWPDDGLSWRDIGGCGDVRYRVISGLVEIEEARNKIYLVQNAGVKSFPRRYISNKYGFSINYPSSWKYNIYNYEIYENFNLDGPVKKGEAVEMTIGGGQVYSTSGALCANKGCDYEGGEVTFNNGYKAYLTKSYIFTSTGNTLMPTETKVENYRFSLPVRELIEDYPYDIYLTASFPDEASGKQILDILSTLK